MPKSFPSMLAFRPEKNAVRLAGGADNPQVLRARKERKGKCW